MLEESHTFWFGSITQCCGAREKSRHSAAEKPYGILREQPAPVPPPSAEPLWPQERPYGRTQERRRPGTSSSRKRSASRGALTGRRGWFSNLSSSSPRRPQISAPSNFRHLATGAYQFSPAEPPPRPARPLSFRPLELNLYTPERQVTPVVPQFGDLEDLITPPPPARTQATWDGSSATLTPQRSFSSTSFHLPRRQDTVGSYDSHSLDVSPPVVPPPALSRVHHTPAIERIVERIASAIIERDRLQDEIDEMIERQSVYVSSRPSTAYGMNDIDIMPSIPALPPVAPSFAQRLSTESHTRPHTAPSQSMAIPMRDHAPAEGPGAMYSPPQTPSNNRKVASPIQVRDDISLDLPLAPPLPLVHRPPLRKKKSFSRVSNWLFPLDGEHRNISMDSVTNSPMPITDREGFYAPIAGMTRTSVDTVSSASSWESEEEDEERQTVPTTAWSPGSSPTIKQTTPKETPNLTITPSPEEEEMETFEYVNHGHRPTSVGVAF